MGRTSSRLVLGAIGCVLSIGGVIAVGCGSDYAVNGTDAGSGESDASNVTDGKSPSDAGAPAVGTRGGACYPNMTCDQGLTCSQNTCTISESTKDTGAPIVCAPITPAGASCFYSGGGPSSGIQCIAPVGGAYNSTCSTVDAGCATDQISCLTAKDCNAAQGPICCFGIHYVSNTTCSVTVTFESSMVSSCESTCGGALAAVGCLTTADCPSGAHCLAVSANEPGDASALALMGLCQY